jgi:spore coat polysaccharide biosynthesis protein SpsF
MTEINTPTRVIGHGHPVYFIADFAANRLPEPWGWTWPVGLDVEVCTFHALEHAWKEAKTPLEREHVMPYFYEDLPADAFNTPGVTISPRGFKVLLLKHEPNHGDLRWTVDTEEDLEHVRRIYSQFGGRDDFTWKDALTVDTQ